MRPDDSVAGDFRDNADLLEARSLDEQLGEPGRADGGVVIAKQTPGRARLSSPA